tara:strand:+ start:227 stop:544 length:318 start_codon:yes stop_codon:yes gene_type:complete
MFHDEIEIVADNNNNIIEEEEEEQIDDSWIDNKDKKILLNHLKELYEKQFSWAAPYLVKTMVKYHYTNTIKNMCEPEQKEKYLLEKIEEKKKENQSLDINEFLKD